MEATGRGTETAGIPTKRVREDELEAAVEMDMVKRFKNCMAATGSGTEIAAIPTKRARQEPDEDEFEEVVERDIVKRFKSNYWDDPAANPDILERYGALMSRLDAEDNESERLLRALDRSRTERIAG